MPSDHQAQSSDRKHSGERSSGAQDLDQDTGLSPVGKKHVDPPGAILCARSSSAFARLEAWEAKADQRLARLAADFRPSEDSPDAPRRRFPRTTRKEPVTNAAAATPFDSLAFSTLAHIDNPDLLKRILDALSQESDDDCLAAALSCRAFSRAVMESHPKGWTTSASGVLSSLERFLWVRGLPDGGPQWLRRWNAQTCSVIASHGGLEVLEWVRASGCGWTETTCHAAAKSGHLEVLQWARANGCEWSAATCTAAAQGGHLEVLQWARANGCEWTSATCVAAARGGHVKVLEWTEANSCACQGVFHSEYWFGQRALGLSRLLSCASAIQGDGYLPDAAANVAHLYMP